MPVEKNERFPFSVIGIFKIPYLSDFFAFCISRSCSESILQQFIQPLLDNYF